MANSVLGRPFVHPLTSFSRRALGLKPDIIACTIYLTENLCEYNMSRKLKMPTTCTNCEGLDPVSISLLQHIELVKLSVIAGGKHLPAKPAETRLCSWPKGAWNRSTQWLPQITHRRTLSCTKLKRVSHPDLRASHQIIKGTFCRIFRERLGTVKVDNLCTIARRAACGIYTSISIQSNCEWRAAFSSLFLCPTESLTDSMTDSLVDSLTTVDCVTTKKSKYVVRYAVLAYCSKYYKYLKGFASLSYSNAAWLTNSKCGIRYAPKKNLNFLIRLLFFTYSCANSKFLIGFAVLANLITYLTNVEAFV